MSYKRAAVIITKNHKILLMKRVLKGIVYHTIVGGSIKPDESPELAAIREIKEETSLDIELGELLWRIDDTKADCYYFSCKSFKGELRLGGPEVKRNSKDNSYELVWIDLKEINDINLKPDIISEKLKEIL